MASRAALLGALGAELLLIISIGVVPAAGDFDWKKPCALLNRCPDQYCCYGTRGTCGVGEFCEPDVCDCLGGYCGPTSKCPAPASKKKKCFPGHATVQLAGGEFKTMNELAVGDRVAVWAGETRLIAYDYVYAFGHKDALAVSSFVRIGMGSVDAEESGTPSATLELSSGHFVPTVQSDTSTSSSLLYKRAQDVVLGDYLWVTNSSGQAATRMVTEISSRLRQGAFNPFTAQGNIVVDGVVASVHSDWFLDTLFNWLGISHHLPAVYQAVLSPARMLYIVLGKELYIATYNFLDARFNLAQLGTEHGGQVVATTVAAGVLAVASGILLTARRSSRYKH